jgi:hypothetical protein
MKRRGEHPEKAAVFSRGFECRECNPELGQYQGGIDTDAIEIIESRKNGSRKKL